MDTNKIGTAKDFFLQLGAIATFYASAIALVTLLFEVINFAYPKISDAYYHYTPSISFQVATLIVAFPLFIFLSWLLQKSYVAEPMLRESLVRRWLAYITLFIAGGVVAGDLITLIYMFLDGQELTTGFLLKILALFVVALGVFFYYMREIRNVITPAERNMWRVVAVMIILGSIILGFSVLGTPGDQRAYRYDNQRVQDLQSIQWQVVNYYQQKGSLPDAREQLNDPLSGWNYPVDPENNKSYYGYRNTGNLTFELCATFSREQFRRVPGRGDGTSIPMIYPGIEVDGKSDIWNHPAGHHCFSRTIDPQFYPQIKR